MKKLFLKSFALVAMLLCGLTASAKQYCHEQLTSKSGDKSIYLTCEKLADGTYQMTIEGESLNGFGGSFFNPGNVDLRSTITSSTPKQIVCSIKAESAPSLYTPLYVMMPGEVAFDWPKDIEWGTCGSGEEKETIKPTMTSASLAEVSHNAAVINVAGTDKETAKGEDVAVTRFKVVNDETSKTYTATDGKIKIEGLELNKTYTFTIYAVDAAGNVSEEGLTVEATTVLDWSKVSYIGSSAGAEYTNQYKVVVVSGKVTIDVIQNPEQTTEPGIYCIFPGAVSSLPIAGKTEGAGAWLYLSAFVKPETEVVIPYAGGSATIIVYNEKGSWDNINFALASNGAKAWASSSEFPVVEAIDGNPKTRWASATKNGDVEMTDAEKNEQWFVVNLGQQREFNTVQILWQDAYGKSFTIDYSADSTTWTNFATIADQTLAGFPYLQTLTVDNPVTAQYVRFNGTARGTQYGYSFWEFQVLKATEDVLTTLELKAGAAIAKVNEGVALTVTGKNQNGVVMAKYGEVQYTVTPADAGVVKDGKYVPAKQGPATIVAAVGKVKSAEVSVFGYEGDNVALSTNIATDNKVIAQSAKGKKGTDAFYAVDGNEGSIWQGSATDGTAEDDASRTYDAWFVLDLGAYYDINLITIKFEGACSDAYHVDASATNNGTDWVVMHNFAKKMGTNGHTDYIYGENLTNNKSVRFVRFWSTKASTQYGMKIYEMKVLATAGSAPADDVKPVMKNAELVSNTYNSAVIAVEATDNMGVASYKVVDATNAFDANYVAVDGKITVTGLTQNTTYNFAVSAVDLAGNVSEAAKTVVVTTDQHLYAPVDVPAAPVHEASNVISIYSDTYESNGYTHGEWNGGSAITKKEIDGNHYNLYTFGESGNGNYFGLELGKEIDVTDMKKLHLDIWSEVDIQSLSIVPIWKVATKGANGAEISQVVALEGQKWNSIDLTLADYVGVTTWQFVHQIKLVGMARNVVALDNIYFWTDGTTTLIDAQEVFPKVSKMIENGQVVIIREGVKYDVTGRAIK